MQWTRFYSNISFIKSRFEADLRASPLWGHMFGIVPQNLQLALERSSRVLPNILSEIRVSVR
jgi:hypothetical protein